MKQVRIEITALVIEECPDRPDGAECKGGDHYGVEVGVATGVGGVAPDQVDEAIMRLVASGGAEAIRRLVDRAPWMVTGDGTPPPGFVPPQESTDGAPTAAELAEAFGDPSAPPRNFAELAAIMARSEGGFVEITDLEELRPLQEALEAELKRDPDRP